MSADFIITEKVSIPFEVAWRNGMPILKYLPKQGSIPSTTVVEKKRGLVIAKISINQPSNLVDMVIGKVDNVGYSRCRLPNLRLLPELLPLEHADAEYAKDLGINIYPSCRPKGMWKICGPVTSIEPVEAAATTSNEPVEAAATTSIEPVEAATTTSNPVKTTTTTSDVEEFNEPQMMFLKSYETSISNVAYIMYYTLILRSLTSRGCTMGYYLKHVAEELDRSYQWYNEHDEVPDHTALNPRDVTSTLTTDKSTAGAWNVLNLILDHHSKLYYGASCNTHLLLASKAINLYLETHQ